MSRPLRIEYPGAWYHVMNRGRRSEEIFFDKEDYVAFCELLKESIEIWNIRVSAYCLMTNHYHLLIQTPEGNLSRCMRHINGVYTQRFNKRHHVDGSLFRGRYKAMLVEDSPYLLQLVKYIHRNPLRAGLVKNVDEYKWSSHKGYSTTEKKWKWMHKASILSMLTEDKKQCSDVYKQFVKSENEEEINLIFEKEHMPSLLGSKGFIEWVKERFFQEKDHEEIPESRKLSPEIERIKEVVCQAYQVEESDLLVSKRGVFNEPRNSAIFLTRELRHNGLEEICQEFHLSRFSSASSAIERTKNELAKSKKMRKRVEKLKRQIIKSQT